jgi:hypothetical protein
MIRRYIAVKYPSGHEAHAVLDTWNNEYVKLSRKLWVGSKREARKLADELELRKALDLEVAPL